MSDLAAMSDMDDTTNDDTTSMVRDGSIQDSRHKPAHILEFQIFLIVRFLAKEGQVSRRDCLRDMHPGGPVVPVQILVVPVLFLVQNPEPNMQMLNRE
jgi:hypothetical protein